jgi:hypothetical protein
VRPGKFVDGWMAARWKRSAFSVTRSSIDRMFCWRMAADAWRDSLCGVDERELLEKECRWTH